MTLLNWHLHENGLTLITDTLSLYGADKSPRAFVAKVWPMQHLSMLVSCTGASRLGNGWAYWINTELKICTIDELAVIAPVKLLEAWPSIGPGPKTSTIYHFGWSPIEGRFKGYAFRSTADFQAEEIPYGVAHKPALKAEFTANGPALEVLCSLVPIQVTEDDAEEPSERVGIGGDLLCYQMARDEFGKVGIDCRHVYRFDDYEADRASMEASPWR